MMDKSKLSEVSESEYKKLTSERMFFAQSLKITLKTISNIFFSILFFIFYSSICALFNNYIILVVFALYVIYKQSFFARKSLTPIVIYIKKEPTIFWILISVTSFQIIVGNAEPTIFYLKLISEFLSENKNSIYFSIGYFILIGFLYFLYQVYKFTISIRQDKDLFAKELWRIRTWQTYYTIQQEYPKGGMHLIQAQKIIQFHHEYNLTKIGHIKSERSKGEIYLFAAELPSIDEIDFEDLAKLNSYRYLEKPCQIKAGQLVEAIYTLPEDEGEYDSSLKKIKILSVTKTEAFDCISYTVAFDLPFYGKREFEFFSYYRSNYFEFIEN